MNSNHNEPRLSRGLKIFIIVGTVVMVGFGAIYFATHTGSSEFTLTKIDPDSTLADKELIVKQDTTRRDTAAADSANKEEEEQAAKVFNSIRGNNIHKVDSTEAVSEEANTETTKPAEPSSTEGGKELPSQSATEPKIENID